MGMILRRWMYLDGEGLTSLHQQLSGVQVLERVETRSRNWSCEKNGGAQIAAMGAQVGVAAEQTRGGSQIIAEKTALSPEGLLLALEAFLATSGALRRIGSAWDVAEIYAAKHREFVTGVLRFRWASSFSSDPVEEARKKQMVEFDLDREVHDDAGMLAVPVRLSGSLAKCVSRKPLDDGYFGPTSHLACFLRELKQDALPLGFFAHLEPYPGLIRLKPYAIWFP